MTGATPLRFALWKVILLFVIFSVLANGAHCFGAGSIPAYAFLHDRAFRHGGALLAYPICASNSPLNPLVQLDLANILTTISKTPHHHTGGGGGLFDLFTTLTTKGLGAVLQGNAAATFSKSDVRRIYFVGFVHVWVSIWDFEIFSAGELAQRLFSSNRRWGSERVDTRNSPYHNSGSGIHGSCSSYV